MRLPGLWVRKGKAIALKRSGSLHDQVTRNTVSTSETGAAIPLIIVFLTVILIFSGLALDTTVVSVTKTEQRQLAETVAISALSTFLNAPPTSPLDTRLNLVRNKVRELIQGNVQFSRPFMDRPADPDDIETERGSITGGANGTLLPGIWHSVPPADCSIYASGTTCPCSPSNTWTTPCFESVNLDQNPEPAINAIKVDLKLEGSSSIKTLFSKVFSNNSTPVRSSATAATYPRHGVFLVDLSRSSHADTHQPYETTNGNSTGMRLSAEYAFSVVGSATDVATCQSAGWPNSAPLNGTCDIRGGVVPQLYRNLWYSNATYNFIPTTPRSGTNPRKHFKGDYRIFDLTWLDPGIRNSPFQETYLVDMYHDPAYSPSSYEGPEPLNSMLAAVNRAMERVAANSVQGDAIGFLGFDFSARVTQREYALSAPGSVPYQQLQNLTDPTNPPPPCLEDPNRNVRECRVLNHLLITRKESSANLPEALQRARQMLTAAVTPNAAEEFAVVMTDGVTNCTNSPTPRTCSNSEAAVQASLTEVENTIATFYAPASIKVHFIHIGSTSGPHTLLAPSPYRKNSDGTSAACMTEDDVAKFSADANTPLKNYKLTDSNFSGGMLNSGGSFNSSTNTYSRSSFYFEPNRLRTAIMKTNGNWYTVRPACVPGSNITPTLEAQCKGRTFAVNGDVPQTFTNSYTDSQGRLMCEPDDSDSYAPSSPPALGAPVQPRSAQRTQIYRAVDKIISRSPYVIVQ